MIPEVLYVVVEEDRGLGAHVDAIFDDENAAVEYANRNGHLYVYECANVFINENE